MNPMGAMGGAPLCQFQGQGRGIHLGEARTLGEATIWILFFLDSRLGYWLDYEQDYW